MWKSALVSTLLVTSACSSIGMAPPARTPGQASTPQAPQGISAPKGSLEGETPTASTTEADVDRPTPPAGVVAFMAALTSRDYAKASTMFEPSMASTLPSDQLAAAWQSILDSAGPFLRTERFQILTYPPRTHVWFECVFERASWYVEVVTTGSRRVSGFQFARVPPAWRAPSYADAATFSERRIGIGTPPLDGTMTVPHATVRGAAVLVHGTGPQDQDAAAGPFGSGTRLFKDLAWGLASQGIAVVRYPKRTWAYPEQFEKTAFTLDDEVTVDACLAIQIAAEQVGVAPERVVLIGHSLGAAMAPRIANVCPRLAGLVMLAGPSRSLDQVLLDQFRYLHTLAGRTAAESDHELIDLVAGFTRAQSVEGPLDEPIVFSRMRGPRSYWMDIAQYDPPEAASHIDHPIFLLQGGRDYQVRRRDFDGWRRALRGRAGVTFKYYPTLDHRFVDGTTTPGPADYVRPGHVASQVIRDITTWVIQRTSTDRS